MPACMLLLPASVSLSPALPPAPASPPLLPPPLTHLLCSPSARKKQQVKQEKTLAAHAEALKAAEKKAAAQLANLRTSGPAATVRQDRRGALAMMMCVSFGVGGVGAAQSLPVGVGWTARVCLQGVVWAASKFLSPQDTHPPTLYCTCVSPSAHVSLLPPLPPPNPSCRRLPL